MTSWAWYSSSPEGFFVPIINPITELAPLNENWLLPGLIHRDHVLLDLLALQQQIPRGQTPLWYGVREGQESFKEAGDDSKQMVFLSDFNPVPKNQWGDVRTQVKAAGKEGIIIHSLGFSIDGDRNDNYLELIAGQRGIGSPGNSEKLDEVCLAPITGAFLKTLAWTAGRRIRFQWIKQPKLASVSGAAQDEVTIVIDTRTEAEFFVAWVDPDVNLSLTLKTPGGMTITPASAEGDPDVTYVSGDTYAYYLIQAPQVGTWTATVSGADGEPYWLQSSGRGPEGQMPLVLEPYVGGGGYEGHATTDRPLVLTTFLVDDAPVGATVEATITLPDGSQVDVTLHDDGGHDDGAAGDGLYGASIAPPLQQGFYDVRFEASGTNGANLFERVGIESIQVVPPLVLDGDPAVYAVGSNEEFEISLSYENDSDAPMYGVTLSANYDSHLTFVSGEPPPDTGNSAWDLGALAPGEYGTLTVTVKTKSGVPAGTKLSTNFEIASGGTPVHTTEVDLIVAGPPANLEVGAGPTTLEADGEEYSEIWAEITDSSGKPTASGLEVTLQTNLGAFPGGATSYKVTSQEGIAIAPLVSITAGKATVTISVEDLTGDTEVTFTGNKRVYLPLVMRNHGTALPYSDDFDNPGSGWDVVETDKGAIGYSQDNYVIRPKVDYWFIWSAAPDVLCTDCTIQVDAWRSTGDNSLYGIVFGLDESVPEFYAYGIQPYTKKYYLKRYGSSGWVDLIGDTGSSYINFDKAANELKVTRDGTKIKLYVNGHYLTTYTDSTYTGSRQVGIFGRSTSESPVWLRYDDFTVWTTGHASMAVSPGEESGHGFLPDSVGIL